MNPYFRDDGGDSELTQLAKTGRNPDQERRYKELLAQAGLPYFQGGNDSNTEQFLAFASSQGKNTGGGGSLPTFNFDYADAEKRALAELEPYYKQKLADAQGDIERAKRLIEEDYARGARFRQEDSASQLSLDTITAEEEKRNLLGELNRRGVLFGEIGRDQTGVSAAPYSLMAKDTYIDPTKEKQQQRRLAIQRAIQRQEEIASADRKSGIEEQNIALPRTQRELEQEKLNKARFEIVPFERNKAYERYTASTNPFIQRA